MRVGLHQPQKEPALLQPLPNRFSKPEQSHSSALTQKSWDAKSPQASKEGDDVNSLTERCMDWCHILSWEQIWWWKRKKAWALKRARRGAQFRLCCFIQDFTWARLTGDIPFTIWTRGYWWRQYIKYLVHFWVLSDVVSCSAGIRQDGFPMAEEGLELRSASRQTHTDFFILHDQARWGMSLGMANFKIQTKSQFWQLL